MPHHLLSAFGAVLVLSALAVEPLALTIKPGTAWPEPEIPVCWEEPKGEHAQERDLVRKAVTTTWERESAVRFVGWRPCGAGSKGIRIALENAYPRTRGRGTEVDGLERGIILPELWSLAALSINLKAPVHEFGHALGFGHEHARPDAPDPERCGVRTADGALHVEPDLPLTPFDPDSIMVACVAVATASFSRGVPRLSALDIFGLIRTYGSDPANVLDRDEPGDRYGAALLVRDLDADGVADLLVGAPGEDGGIGAVYLYAGHRIQGFRPRARYTPADFGGEAEELGFGSSLSWVASDDVDDGRVLVHAAPGTAGFELVPKASALPVAGERGEIGHRPATAGTDAGPLLARATAAFPRLDEIDGGSAQVVRHDINGDGADDLVVGLPHGSGAVERSGIVVVFRGDAARSHGPARSVGVAPWYWFGQAY